jgi:short-subunit dehydrogenase
MALVGSAGLVLAGSAVIRRGLRAPLNLEGKIVLVTGGSRGLGLALAHELGQRGCELVLSARDATELEAAREKLLEDGMEAAVVAADIGDQGERERLVSQVIERFGRIDVLVNNAGEIRVAPLDALEDADFEDAMKLMFWAPAKLTLSVLPHMKRANSGTVVNVTSVGGRVAMPHLLPYSCAKFALVGFSTGLSAELRPPLHALTVVPGLMRTGSYLNAQFKGEAEKEFGWFGLLSNTPGVSVSVESAARAIREAIEKRKYTCTISLPANALIRSEACFPETTRTVMAAVNRWVLPASATEANARTGRSLNAEFGAIFQAMTSLGRAAARNWNE